MRKYLDQIFLFLLILVILAATIPSWKLFKLDLTTIICCYLILVFFYFYYCSLIKIIKFIPNKKASNNSKSTDERFEELTSLYDNYMQTVTIQMGEDQTKKTTCRAEEIFSLTNVVRALNVNLKTVNSVPGVLSGLGVLGTFFGVTIGISNFDSSSSDTTMESINHLLNGMTTAFCTSIFGMFLSLWFLIRSKKILNDLYHATAEWCKHLDKLHYISEVDILRFDTLAQQQMMMEKLTDIHLADKERSQVYRQILEGMKDKLEELCSTEKENGNTYKNGITELMQLQTNNYEAMKEMFTGYDDEGEEVIPGQLFVHLYEESAKQSQALESFTTDLSNELNSSLGTTMDTSIVPLIQNIEKTHQTFNEKLDTLASNIQSPATDLITSVVGELKSSMTQVSQEFKDSISTDTVNQINQLVDCLSQATQILNTIPSTMQTMSDNITLSFGNVKDIITQLQESVKAQQQMLMQSTQTANQEMGIAMKTQFNEMAEALQGSVNAMNDGVTNNLSNAQNIIRQMQNDIKEQQMMLIESTNQASTTMMNGMKKQFEEMITLLNTSMSSLNMQQNDLIEGQSKSSREIERLLFSFDESIKKMKVSNQEVSRTLVSLQSIGDNMDKSAEKLNEMSTQMTSLSHDMQMQHEENIKHFHKVQEGNQETLEAITEALSNSKAILEKYTEQYTIISGNLENIFKQIDEGLRGYSATLRESTKDALAEYSNALTASTKGLESIAGTLNETAEELNDSIDKMKGKLR